MTTQKFGRYEIIRELGRGGMGTVYLAHDPVCTRQVVVKVLPQQFTHDPQFRERFVREAKVIAALESPSIVPVYDYGEEGNQPFIVMRYMPGGTLAARINGQPMSLAEVIPIIQRVSEALDEAHTQKIIHRDLKPANILFDARGNAFLSDFGIAKVLESSAAFTGTAVVGTPAYMSPEQAIGDKELDYRSDIYSLGIILYEMLTGQQPYQADTPMRLMLKHINSPVPQLDTDQLGLPSESQRVLERALAKAPDDRYPTVNNLSQELGQLETLPGVTPNQRLARPTPPTPPSGNQPPARGAPTPPPSRPHAAPSPVAVTTRTPPPGNIAPVSNNTPPTMQPVSRPQRRNWWWLALPTGIGVCAITMAVSAYAAWNLMGAGPATATLTRTQTATPKAPTRQSTATPKPTTSATATATEIPETATATMSPTVTATITRTRRPYVSPRPTFTFTPPPTDTPPQEHHDPPPPSLAPP